MILNLICLKTILTVIAFYYLQHLTFSIMIRLLIKYLSAIKANVHLTCTILVMFDKFFKLKLLFTKLAKYYLKLTILLMEEQISRRLQVPASLILISTNHFCYRLLIILISKNIYNYKNL